MTIRTQPDTVASWHATALEATGDWTTSESGRADESAEWPIGAPATGEAPA